MIWVVWFVVTVEDRGDGWILSDGENAKTHVISSLMFETQWIVFHAERTVALSYQNIEDNDFVSRSGYHQNDIECGIFHAPSTGTTLTLGSQEPTGLGLQSNAQFLVWMSSNESPIMGTGVSRGSTLWVMTLYTI
jgi:hypothetical protein